MGLLPFQGGDGVYIERGMNLGRKERKVFLCCRENKKSKDGFQFDTLFVYLSIGASTHGGDTVNRQ
jgi:hypothetical protein